jgi:putative glutamine amidotransferase
MKGNRPVIGITTDLEKGHNSIEAEYAHAVARTGGLPVLIPTVASPGDLHTETLRLLDGLILPGSRDMDPKYYGEEPHEELRPMSLDRTETELYILELVVDRAVPVLGICGGMQLLNVFYGGTLYQDIAAFLPDAIGHEKGAEHGITIDDGSKLAGIIGESGFNVKSYHHQAVKKVGRDLRVSAAAPDGIVEGIESGDDSFVLGIQWHPERDVTDPISKKIFESFIEKCRK